MDQAYMDKKIKFGKILDQILWNTLFDINTLLESTCLATSENMFFSIFAKLSEIEILFE